jgi:hypothetical protein
MQAGRAATNGTDLQGSDQIGTQGLSNNRVCDINHTHRYSSCPPTKARFAVPNANDWKATAIVKNTVFFANRN